MKTTQLVHPSSFCWNKKCPDYAKLNRGNIVKFGRIAKGTQRYQYSISKKAFMGNKGTVFYRRHHSPETILECLAMVAKMCSLASIHRVKGIKEETVIDWLREAAVFFYPVWVIYWISMMWKNRHLAGPSL